jgi:hypothetical protein
MDCLRSFCFKIAGNENTSPAEFAAWGVAPQNYWQYSSTNPNSSTTITGFKNINIYSIEMIGNVDSTLGGGQLCLVQDYSFDVTLNNGQNAIPTGVISGTNGYNLIFEPISPLFRLSKFNTKISFETPVQSSNEITISDFRANGIGAQNPLGLSLSWNLTFVVNYLYEGD